MTKAVVARRGGQKPRSERRGCRGTWAAVRRWIDGCGMVLRSLVGVVDPEGSGMSGGSARDGSLVFVSYSREDADWRRTFVGILEPRVRRRGC